MNHSEQPGNSQDEAGFAPLLEHSDFLRRLSRRLVSDDDAASELEQSTWLIALERSPRTLSSVRGWLSTVLRNLSRESHRRDRRRRERERTAARSELREDSTDKELILREITDAVFVLKAAQREVVLLRYYEDLSTNEIAARLRVPVETVRTRLKRAHVSLRNSLDGSFGSDRRAWLFPLCDLFDLKRTLPLTASAQSSSVLESYTTGTVAMNTKLIWGAVAICVIALATLIARLDPQDPEVASRDSTETARPEPSSTATSGSPRSDVDPDNDEAPIVAVAAAEPTLGRVIHAITGEPLSGVSVVALSSRGFYFDPEPIADVQTDSDGWFELRSVDARPTDTVLRFFKPGYVSRELSRNESPNYGIVNLTPGVVVTGQLVFEDGTPARGGWAHQLLSISVLPAAVSQFGRTESIYSSFERVGIRVDEQGRFETATNEPLIAFEVKAENSAPAFSAVHKTVPGEKNHLVIQVRRGQTLSGRITDSSDEGIEGATIVCFPRIEPTHPDHLFFAHHTRMDARTRSDGSFAIPHMTSEFTSYQVIHPSHATVSAFNQIHSSSEPLMVALDSGRSVTFRCADADGSIAPQPHDVHMIARSKTVSFELDRDGVFRTGPLGIDVERLSLRIRGWNPLNLDLPTDPEVDDLGTIQLTRQPSVTVTVRDSAGKPIVGARVRAIRIADSRPIFDLRSTHRDGRAIVFDPGVDAKLQIDHPEYAPRTVPINEATEVDVELEPGATLSGRVIDDDASPIPGAAVWVTYEQGDTPLGRQSPVATSDEGLFVIPGVLPGRPVVVHARLRGYQETAAPHPGFDPGDTIELGPITLGTGVTVSGVVRDPAGHGIEGAIVGCERMTGSLVTGIARLPWAISDPQGRYSISGLEPGRYAATARAIGYRPVRLDKRFEQNDETLDIDLAPQSVSLYRGRVVDTDGQPVRSASVEVHGSEDGQGWYGRASTEENGTFTIADIPTNTTRIEVNAKGFVRFHRRLRRGQSLPPELVLQRGATLEIAIHASGSRPLPDFVRYTFEGKKGGRRGSSVPLIRGVARITGLHEGPGTVRVKAYGFPRSVQYPVHLENERTVGVEVELDGDALNPTVRVTNSFGEPIEAAAVSMKATNGDHLYTVRTDEQGVAESPEILVSQETWIQVEASGYAWAHVRDLEGRVRNGRVEVTLEAESAIELQVLELDGSPIAAVSVSVSGSERPATDVQTTSDGRARISQLTAGTYQVSIRDGRELLAEATIELRAGQVLQKSMRIRPPLEFWGTVTRSGKPVKSGELEFRSTDGPERSTAWLTDGTFRLNLRANGTIEVRYKPRRGRARVTTIERVEGSKLEIDVTGRSITVR